jgi:hypothetical protein
MLITDRCVKPLQFIIQWPLNFYYERLLEFANTINGMLENANDSQTILSYFSCAFFLMHMFFSPLLENPTDHWSASTW